MAAETNQVITEVSVTDKASAVLARINQAASQAAEGAAKFDGAIAGIETSTVRSTRSLETAARGFETWKAKADPAYASAQNLAKAQKDIERAVALGVATQAEGAQALARLADAQGKAATGAYSLATRQQILQSGVLNTVQSIGAGLPVFQTLTTQLLQTAPAFISSTGAAIGWGAAVAAVAAPIAILALRMSSISDEAREFGVALRATGRDAQTTTAQLHAVIEAMRDQGLSADQARGITGSLLRNPGVSASQVSRIGLLANDAAAGFGGKPEDMAKRLAEAASSGYPAIKKFNDEFGVLTASQLSAARSLAEAGNRAGAAGILFQAVETRTKGLASALETDLTKAINQVSRGFTELTDKVLNSQTFLGAVKTVSDFLEMANTGTLKPSRSLADLSDADLAAKLATAQRHGNDNAVRLIQQEAARRNPISPPLAGVTNATTTPTASVAPILPAYPAVPDDKTTAYIEDLQRQLKDQRAITAAPIGARAEVEARLNAAKLVRDNSLSGTGVADQVADLQAGLANQTQFRAANDNLVVLRNTADAANRIAEAYARSEAAGRAQEAVEQARAEALRNVATNQTAVAQAIQAANAANAVRDARRQIRDLTDQETGERALAEAQKGGAVAVAEQARQNDVAAFKRKTLAQMGGVENDVVRELVAQYEALTKARLADQQTGAANERLRGLRDELDVANAELAAVGMTAERRAKMVADVQTTVALRNNFGDNWQSDPRALQEKASRDQLTDVQAAKAKAEEYQKPFERAGERIQDSLSDAVSNGLSGGIKSFQDFGQQILQIWTRIVAELAVASIMKPAISNLTGGLGLGGWVGSLFGGGASAGGAVATSSTLTNVGAQFSGPLGGFANGGVMTPWGPMPLQAYSNGGIATGPQLAVYGEGRQNEAYVPLPDGRSIPVTMQGGGGGGSTVVTIAPSITVNAKGGTQAENADLARQTSNAVAQQVEGMVLRVIQKQQKPGGMLNQGYAA